MSEGMLFFSLFRSEWGLVILTCWVAGCRKSIDRLEANKADDEKPEKVSHVRLTNHHYAGRKKKQEGKGGGEQRANNSRQSDQKHDPGLHSPLPAQIHPPQPRPRQYNQPQIEQDAHSARSPGQRVGVPALASPSSSSSYPFVTLWTVNPWSRPLLLPLVPEEGHGLTQEDDGEDERGGVDEVQDAGPDDESKGLGAGAAWEEAEVEQDDGGADETAGDAV